MSRFDTDKTIELKDSKNAWPINSPGFLLTKEFEIENHNVFCIRIPEWIFVPEAMGFYDADMKCRRALVMLGVVQLWLLTLKAAMLRVCKNLFKPDEFAFVVMLEMLMDRDGKKTNNHRLWIFERASNKQHPIGNIFMEAVESDKRLDSMGEFVDFSKPDHATGHRSSGGENSGGGGGGGGAGEGPAHKSGGNGGNGAARGEEGTLPYSEYYKRINSIPALAAALDVYLNEGKFSADSKSYVATEAMAPELNFHITTAFSLADSYDPGQDASRRLNINPAQMDTQNYIFMRGNQRMVRLPFFKNTYHIPAYSFLKGPNRMMTRMFPGKQMNEKHLAWSGYMMEMVRRSRERFAALQAKLRQDQEEKHAARMAAHRAAAERAESRGFQDDHDDDDDIGGPDSDDDDSDEPEEEDEAETAQTRRRMLMHSDNGRIVDADDDELIRRRRRIDIDFPAMAVGSQVFFDAPLEMRNDQVDEIADFFKFTSEIKNSTQHLDDFTAELSMFYKVQKQLICGEYMDNPEERHRALASLRMIVYEKFMTHCTSGASEVSDAQRKHNAYYTAKDLGNRHWKVPIADPKLSVVENAIIWMIEGFTWKDNVATSQFLCFLSYIGIGDRWRRELNLHLNFLYTGGNGMGKSLIIEVTQKNILEETTTMINGKSGKADAINGVSTDVVICSDDANLATYFSVVGGDCDAKSHMTTMRTTRAILDMTMEVDSDGTKRTVRRQTHLMFIQIRCLMLGTNESLTDIENSSNGFFQSAQALYNRFLSIEVPCYDNKVRTVSASIAAQSAKNDQMKETEDEFHDLNIRFDCLRGWAHKLMSIDHDIFHIDMRVFDLVWAFLTEHLSTKGIKSDHPRVAIQAKLWCQQLVLYDAYLRAHCMEQCPNYVDKKTITALSLSEWVPVCFEHHVFITMSAFYRFFVPQAMESVLDVLNSLMEDSFKANDGRAIFVGKKKRLYEMSKDKNVEDRQMRILSRVAGAAPLPKPPTNPLEVTAAELYESVRASANARDINPVEMAAFNAVLIGVNDPTLDDEDFERNIHEFEEDIDQRAKAKRRADRDKAAAEAAAAHADDLRRVQENLLANYRIAKEIDDADGAAQAHAPAGNAPPPPANGSDPIDATYVHFNYTFAHFATFAQMHMKTERSPMQPGTSSIMSALRRLENTPVMSSRYILESINQTTPTLDDTSPEIINQALIHDRKNNTFDVHYSMLVKNGHFRSALTNAITAYCHRNIVPRKIMLATENPKYPFVLATMNVLPTDRVMTIPNPSYVMHTTIAGYHGSDDRMKTLAPAERPMNWEFNHGDMDTFALLSYFKDAMDVNLFDIEDIMLHHPLTISQQQQQIALKQIISKGAYNIKKYPEDWIDEYEAVEYYKDVSAPANDPRRKKADDYIIKNKIVRSAPFIQSLLDINKVDDEGQQMGDVVVRRFTTLKRTAAKLMENKLYEMTAPNSVELVKAINKHQEEGAASCKQYKRGIYAALTMQSTKRNRMLMDFDELAARFPSTHQQEERRHAADQAGRREQEELFGRYHEEHQRERTGANDPDDDADPGPFGEEGEEEEGVSPRRTRVPHADRPAPVRPEMDDEGGGDDDMVHEDVHGDNSNSRGQRIYNASDDLNRDFDMFYI